PGTGGPAASAISTGASATTTITNDDSETLAITSPSITEGNASTKTLTFTVTSPKAVEGGFTVLYSTADGSASAAESDYAAQNGTLTFAGTTGETQTVSITINGDTVVEDNETFTVTLGAV